MNKHKKKLLGFLGLVFVAAMTMVASTIPAGALGSGSSTLNVTITSSTLVTITSPADEYQSLTNNIALAYDYFAAESATVTVYYNNAGSWDVKAANTAPLGTPNGTVTQNVLLPAGFGDYIINVKVSVGGEDRSEDSITVHYGPSYLVEKDRAENHDPVVQVFNDNVNVCSVEITVMTPTMDDTVLNKTVTIGDQEPTALPFYDNNVETGDYILDVDTMGCGENAGIKVGYKYQHQLSYEEPNRPTIPDTGSVHENLNLSKEDFLISSCLIFFGSAIGAIVFISKRK